MSSQKGGYMALWQLYLALSLCIGLVLTTYKKISFYRNPTNKSRFDKRIIPDVIEEAIEKGHIQREVFGDRTILYPKDNEGRFLFATTDLTTNLSLNQEMLFFVATVIYVAVIWPYDFYIYSKHYFSKTD